MFKNLPKSTKGERREPWLAKKSLRGLTGVYLSNKEVINPSWSRINAANKSMKFLLDAKQNEEEEQSHFDQKLSGLNNRKSRLNEKKLIQTRILSL